MDASIPCVNLLNARSFVQDLSIFFVNQKYVTTMWITQQNPNRCYGYLICQSCEKRQIPFFIPLPHVIISIHCVNPILHLSVIKRNPKTKSIHCVNLCQSSWEKICYLRPPVVGTSRSVTRVISTCMAGTF